MTNPRGLGVGRWALGVVTALSLNASTSVQWPQWRGSSRDGAVPATAIPKWPEKWTRVVRDATGLMKLVP